MAEWPTGTMRALSIEGPRDVRVVTRPIPAPQPGHALVRVSHVGLCGTDAELYTGASPFFAQGTAAYPLTPGHEWSGTVVATAPGVTHVRVGDRVVGDPFVTCGHCEMCRVDRRNLCVRRREMGVRTAVPGAPALSGAAAELVAVPDSVLTCVPAQVGLDVAALVEPAVTAIEGVRRCAVGPRDRVAVIGTGTLGLLAAMAAVATGARVEAVGVEDAGLALARELGCVAAHRPRDAPADSCSVVVEASGAEPAFGDALRIAAPGGRVALLGIPPGDVRVPGAAAVLKDLTIHGVLGGVHNWAHAVGLVTDGSLRAAELIDDRIPFAEGHEGFRRLVEGPRRRPKLLLAVGDA